VPGERAQCIVVVGGDAPAPDAAEHVWPDAFVVAADSGVDHAHALGLHVDVAVGDFDSVTPEGLRAAEAAGARVERHRAEKDHTDLELALDVAAGTGAREIVVIGGHGGRLDHLFANLLVLAAPRLRDADVTAHLGPARVDVVHGRGGRTIPGAVGDLVTLLPVHGDAVGVRTAGLRYPLRGETLPAGTSRGVSNVFEAPLAEVALEVGTVVVVQPGTDGGEA